MNVHPYLDALHDSWLGHIMRDVPWLFPTCEGLHFVGMSLLLGTIGVIDLRVLGFFKGLPIGPLHRMLPLAFFGFALNVATGVGFVCSDPDSYWIVGAFRLKMVLIMLAGLNALYRQRQPSLNRWIEIWCVMVTVTAIAAVIRLLSP